MSSETLFQNRRNLLLVLLWSAFLVLPSDHSNSSDRTNSTSSVLVRNRRVPYHHHKGYFFPISSYTVKKHKPGGGHGWKKSPEIWEYKGQYLYGFKKKKHLHPPVPIAPLAIGALAAGLPLILTPLLGLLMSVPVFVPTAITASAGRRRRRSPVNDPNPTRDVMRTLKLRELQIMSNYLEEVHYDENRHQRLLADYLKCQGLLDNHCLERLACECSHWRRTRAINKLEKTVTSILLGHVLGNRFVPTVFKKRLKSAARFGRQNYGRCAIKYFCRDLQTEEQTKNRHPPPNINRRKFF